MYHSSEMGDVGRDTAEGDIVPNEHLIRRRMLGHLAIR